MAGASGPIRGPQFGTLPEKPASKAGLYKYTVQAPGLERKDFTGPGLGLSAGGG